MPLLLLPLGSEVKGRKEVVSLWVPGMFIVFDQSVYVSDDLLFPPGLSLAVTQEVFVFDQAETMAIGLTPVPKLCFFGPDEEVKVIFVKQEYGLRQ